MEHIIKSINTFIAPVEKEEEGSPCDWLGQIRSYPTILNSVSTNLSHDEQLCL